MDAMSAFRRPRRGFTLIEMLAVVVIVGILAALITAAAIAARRRARLTRIRVEISQLEEALGHYKAKFGDYPPDFTDEAAVVRHLGRAFPRYAAIGWKADLAAVGVDANELLNNPPAALVFFLGGIRADATGTTKLIYFSANQKNPFDNSPSRLKPFFDFYQPRLRPLDPLDKTGPLLYYPDIGMAVASNPYVYFRSRGAVYSPDKGQLYMSKEGSEVKPYYDVPIDDWANAKSFQILCAGLDDVFGNGQQFHADADYEEANYDNISNFSNITMEDELP